MPSGPHPRKRRLAEPFTWIILGAVLVFVSSTVSGILGVVLLVEEFTPAMKVAVELLLPVIFGLAFVSPVGSFILLVGLARAVRSPPFAAAEPPTGEGPGASGAVPAHLVNPYHIALLGAAVALIGGLAGASAGVVRYLFPLTWPYGTILEYLLTWTLVLFVTGTVAAVGSLLAFVGVGLSVRDAARGANRL